MTDLPINAIRFPKRNIRLVRQDDCQGERPYRARLMDQLRAVRAGLDSGLTAAEIRRFERERCIASIRATANTLALFETPAVAADALRSVADEMEGKDIA